MHWIDITIFFNDNLTVLTFESFIQKIDLEMLLFGNGRFCCGFVWNIFVGKSEPKIDNTDSICVGVGIAGYLMVRYNHDTSLTIMTISRYNDSVIINIFIENPIIIHHNIYLNKMPVKRLSASFLY